MLEQLKYFLFPVINLILLSWHHGPVNVFSALIKNINPLLPLLPYVPLPPNDTLSRQANWSALHS